MKFITNAQVADLITIEDAIAAMWSAFNSMQSGAQQARNRISAGLTTLSTMGAILPITETAGVKVYTTLHGKFRFVIVLFSASDGAPLAVIEADEMTGFRTAAATAVAANFLARADAKTLAVIGTGFQARAHIPALRSVRTFSEILIAGVENQERFAADVERETGIPARAVGIEEAAASADVLLTATRACTPLFSGDLLREGAFIAAIGASKGNVRELDDTAIGRASAIVVEWKPQAREEAGELLMCAPGIFDWNEVLELGQVVSGTSGYVRKPSDIVIYKAVGIGLEDVALASLVYRRAQERYGWQT